MTIPAAVEVERGYVVPDAKTGFVQADYEENPELQWPNSVWVYDRMRKEPQINAVLRALTYPVRRTPWRVDPAGARGKVVSGVAEDFGLPILGKKAKPADRTRDRFSWQEHLRLALLSLAFGHSVFAQQYRILPTGKGGSLQARLRKLGYRPPKTIDSFDVATDGGLNAVIQKSPGIAAGPRLDIKWLVVYSNDREGGNWEGQSVLRPAFGPWWLKQDALRVMAASFNRNGLGVPVYTGSEQPEGLDADEVKRRQDEEKVEGLKLATSLRAGENAGVYKPHGAALELMGVTGRTPDIERGIRLYNEEIARSVLAMFMTLGGDNSTGSYALGDTFEDFFTMSLQTVAWSIAEVVTQHAVEDWVDLNYGAGEPAPRIVFDEIGTRLTAEAIVQLITAGAISKDEPLEAHLRIRAGFPEADPKTRRETPVAEPPAEPPPGGDTDDQPDPEEEQPQ